MYSWRIGRPAGRATRPHGFSRYLLHSPDGIRITARLPIDPMDSGESFITHRTQICLGCIKRYFQSISVYRNAQYPHISTNVSCTETLDTGETSLFLI
jgi:hypothetical protein